MARARHYLGILNPQREPFWVMQPVGVEGNRLSIGGHAYYPKTDFLTAVEPGDDILKFNTHCYLSQKPARRKAIREALANSQYNSIYVYTLNQGDYGAGGSHKENVVTPYGDAGFSLDTSALNTDRIAEWRSHVDQLLKAGLKPFIWLAADDSPAIKGMDDATWTTYAQHMVDAFEDYPILWVLGLELDEYWSSDVVAARVKDLRARTKHPVGVHLTTGGTAQGEGAFTTGADFIVGQLGTGKPDAHYISAVTDLASMEKPWIAGEYNVKSQARSIELGRLMAELGEPPLIAGVGNGINLNADWTPPDPHALPFTLDQVVWLHKDISGWPITSVLGEVTVGGGKICIPYDKADVWPEVYPDEDAVVGNPWVFMEKDGTWYAATWEWLRPGQTCKNQAAVAGDHIKKSPFDAASGWKPTSGQTLYFMVSGLARLDGITNVSERTNIVKFVWP